MFVITLFSTKNKTGSRHGTHEVEVEIHEGEGVQDSLPAQWHPILVHLSRALCLVCTLHLALAVSDSFTLVSTPEQLFGLR